MRLVRVLVHISRLHRAPCPGRRRVQGRENKTDPRAGQGRPADQIAWRGRAQEAATVRKGIPADVEVSVDDHRAATSTARPAASTGCAWMYNSAADQLPCLVGATRVAWPLRRTSHSQEPVSSPKAANMVRRE